MQNQDRIPDKALAKMGVNMDLLKREREIVDEIHVLEEDADITYPRIKQLTQELIDIQRRQPEIGPKFS